VNLARLSVLAFALMVVGLAWLAVRHEIIAHTIPGRVVQVAAVMLMIAARIAFGMRSFHAAANPTEGGLVTTGPYRWLRHPIYAAVLYFFWAAALDYHSPEAIAAALLITIGSVVRMLSEEQLLVRKYPEYAGYKARTARVIPFIL
jgi:protein-S-isoprenylcysteine O-methyltransferase Ste14